MNCVRFVRLIAAASLVASLPAAAAIDHVIAISVDGCRGDYLQTFIEGAPAEFPNFTRLRDASACTYNARCDFTDSITIPDHLCMITGRPVRAPAGMPSNVCHGVTNDSPAAIDTVHNSGLNIGTYKAGIFDVVHDSGLSTALYMGKARLAICDRSWNSTNGAPDTTGVDNGQDKIDFAMIVEASGNTNATPGLVASFVAAIASGTLKNFTLFHIADADYAGHSGGWSTNSGSAYRNAMKSADGWLGQILDAVQSNATLAGRTAILLTADHGGGTPPTSHGDATKLSNCTIPFFFCAPGIPVGTNIHACFENRADPAATIPEYTSADQPMRNGDIANLSATLLGLPPVPGALIVPVLKAPVMNIVRATNAASIQWPGYHTGWHLDVTDDLAAGNWLTITNEPSATNGQFILTDPAPLPDKHFFRLIRP